MWTQGDTEPPLTDIAGVDLTGATCAVHVRRPGGGVITRAPSVTDAATGAWSLPWLAGELDATGVYEFELEVTFTPGRVRTFDGPSFRVKPQLDDSGLPWVPGTEQILDGGVL